MRKILTLVPAVALAFAACSDTSTGPHSMSTGPLFNTNEGVCEGFGDFHIGGSITGGVILEGDWILPNGGSDQGSVKIDTEGDPASVTVTAPAGYLISGYCVKAGSANQEDGGPVFIPVDPAQKTVVITYPTGKDVSHISLTFIKEADDNGSEWCSPGYWRQPQHLGSWEATGYNTTDLYSTVFGAAPTRSNKGMKDGAPTDPTLLEVLQNPQWYGGDAFNAVGDLLSDAHPDVDFNGDRVEDSCPLGRAD